MKLKEYLGQKEADQGVGHGITGKGTRAEVQKNLEKLDFWERLTASQREDLIQKSYFVSFGNGAIMHRGSTECTGLISVAEGKVRVFLMSEEGRDVTLYRLTSGEHCVLTASCILEEITFDVFLEAQGPCRILVIPNEVYQSVMMKNIYVEASTYRLATQHFSDVIWVLQQIMFMGLDQRLAIYLSDEAASSGSLIIEGTHEDIARNISSAREAVSRMLKYFSTEGLVELARGQVKILDKNALFKMATGNRSNDSQKNKNRVFET